MESATNVHFRTLELQLKAEWEKSRQELIDKFGLIILSTQESHWCAFLMGYTTAVERSTNDLRELSKIIEAKLPSELPHD